MQSAWDYAYAEEAKQALIVEAPAPWKVEFKGDKGMQFYTVTRKEGAPALLMFSRTPAPGNVKEIWKKIYGVPHEKFKGLDANIWHEDRDKGLRGKENLSFFLTSENEYIVGGRAAVFRTYFRGQASNANATPSSGII